MSKKKCKCRYCGKEFEASQKRNICYTCAYHRYYGKDYVREHIRKWREKLKQQGKYDEYREYIRKLRRKSYWKKKYQRLTESDNKLKLLLKSLLKGGSNAGE